jgi:hypothetical protein
MAAANTPTFETDLAVGADHRLAPEAVIARHEDCARLKFEIRSKCLTKE